MSNENRAAENSGTALRSLRGILGKTQAEFAKMVGVSLALIKAIERGRLPVTEKLARRIRVATGAKLGTRPLVFDPDRALPRARWALFKGGEIRSGWGSGPYTIEVFHRHLIEFGAGCESEADDRLDEMIPDLRALFRAAAAKSKNPGASRHRLPALVVDLQEWMEEANERFQLRAKFP